MAKVTLSGVNKWYGGVVHAVQDISFEIADGEFFGLLGPSGSGKTSVLRMLAGLEKPTSGTIAFDGVPVERQTPQARNVAMVFEQNALYPHMTARQNISYPLRIRGLPRTEIDAKVGEVADMLNIRHLVDRRASQMSGGQQQRVAIARALVRRPNLLCLDEPIAHLDTLLRARLRGELKRLQRSLGTTSVIVTHDPIEAMTMTDRIAVMRDGLMQQIGTADEIYNRPVNAFVAQFFGLHSMNIFEVDGIEGSAALSGRCGGEAVSLPDMVRNHIGPDQKLVLGARPSGVAVHKPGEVARDRERVMLAGRVYVAEQLGDALLVTVQSGDTTLQAMTAPDRRFAIDEPVEMSIREDSLYVFEGTDRHAVRHATGTSSAVVDRLMANYG
jgi:ABC-type sugar transport system ATPase subunit